MAEETLIGRKVGSWLLESELGQGGMGAVYLARHASLALRAAVKVLSPGLESVDSFRQRFRREAELQSQLRHPNIARILDYLEDGGRWFLVVEYVDGGSLAEVLERRTGPVGRSQALLWARQALAGLGFAHKKGIVHRDVKPANLLLNESGEVVVADFGIARADASPGLTTTGIAVGTPQYMSPEQILTPEAVDSRADIYSLGVVLYQLLSGRTPFDSGSQFAILQAHVSEPPPPLRTLVPEISPVLEAVVMRSLAKRAGDRHPDCDAMARELESAALAPVGERHLNPSMAGATVRQSVAEVAGSSVAPVGLDQTMRATSFRPSGAPAAPVAQIPAMSAAEFNAIRRRIFRRRMLVGAASLVGVAGLFAFQAAQTGKEEPAEPKGAVASEQGALSASPPPAGASETAHLSPKSSAGPGGAGFPASMPANPPSQLSGPQGALSPTVPTQVPPQAPTPMPQFPGQGLPQMPPGGVPQMPPGTPGLPPGMPPGTSGLPPGMNPGMPPGLPPGLSARALPDRPQVAVLAGGDPILGVSLEQEIERRLSRRFEVVDEHGDPDVDEMLERKGSKVSQKELGTKLIQSGFHVLVLLRVEAGDSQTVKFKGLHGSLTPARIRMNAYLLPTGRTLGPGWTETLEYTELSAQGKAKNAFIGPTADLIQAIQDGWSQLRAAAGAR